MHRFRYAVYPIVGLVLAYGIGVILLFLLICKPIAYNWDKTLQGHCGSSISEGISAAAINMIIDGLIVLLPIPVVWGLQMPTPKKIGISCMFGLGLV